jgi:hypothetical protein
MTDTPPEVEELYQKMLMARSNEERFMMGIGMFETARKFVLASLPPDASPRQVREHLLQRFYGLSLESLERAQAA